jgi:hypothetical protein
MTRRRPAGKLGDSRQHFPPMCERDADLFRIRIRQMAEHRDINVVLGKSFSVLPEAELLKPIRNLLHRRPPTDLTPSVLDRQERKSTTCTDYCRAQGKALYSLSITRVRENQ